jgi:hypothetical protein
MVVRRTSTALSVGDAEIMEGKFAQNVDLVRISVGTSKEGLSLGSCDLTVGFRVGDIVSSRNSICVVHTAVLPFISGLTIEINRGTYAIAGQVVGWVVPPVCQNTGKMASVVEVEAI